MTKPSALTGLGLADALGHEVADKRLDILRRIGQAGSISEAARGARVSYKAAWQAIDTLTNLAGTPLLERTVGGTGGGGAQLTPAAHQLLQAAALLQAQRLETLRQVVLASAGTQHPTPRLAGLGLRTSLRNQLPADVVGVQKSGRLAHVTLQVLGGALLASRITRESAELLELQKGQPVIAMIKATAVAITAPDMAVTKGHCALQGHVARVSRDKAGDEVVLALAGDMQCVGFAGPGYRWKLGEPAQAQFDASAVALAVDS